MSKEVFTDYILTSFYDISPKIETKKKKKKNTLFAKFQLILDNFTFSSYIDDYVCFIAPTYYCVELSPSTRHSVKNCSDLILK